MFMPISKIFFHLKVNSKTDVKFKDEQNRSCHSRYMTQNMQEIGRFQCIRKTVRHISLEVLRRLL